MQNDCIDKDLLCISSLKYLPKDIDSWVLGVVGKPMKQRFAPFPTSGRDECPLRIDNGFLLVIDVYCKIINCYYRVFYDNRSLILWNR